MTDSFHATVKLITGEEILTQLMHVNEEGKEYFVFQNPIVIGENNQVDIQKGIVVSGLTPKKWLLFSSDDMCVVNREDVITVSELDKFGVEFYRKALMAALASNPVKRKVETKRNSGYVGKIESFRSRLEDVYDSSPDLPKGT